MSVRTGEFWKGDSSKRYLVSSQDLGIFLTFKLCRVRSETSDAQAQVQIPVTEALREPLDYQVIR